ncbi:hypothetical protein C8J46_10218 [Sphingomonas sp. PP-F2F-A104-K0414]|uniref:hypothetical protein n=1 Tax=Sphingomonas sp. PP-F2F-A104-K0414 TaxID=2135661 RepID=UPI00104B1496|nr:hypothetical protein [Sphingomonas sp. PP-F2F-A104-K0414]TCP99880.1 hypothetical protein C8J46_10218 [Sphingomonas sp. PP-F2F-A104-K0414]
MASLPIHPMTCGCDRCPRPADDEGFQTFVMIVSGLGTGAILIGPIEAVRILSPLVAELIR